MNEIRSAGTGVGIKMRGMYLVFYILFLYLGILSFPSMSMAQGLKEPLLVGVASAVVDEWGVRLEGTSSEPGDLVEIRSAPDGIIYHPRHPSQTNALITSGVTGIGAMTSPSLTNAALFSHAIESAKPSDGTKIFVRVYNSPTVEQATFFADSQVFTVDGNTPFIANVSQTLQGIYTNDYDGDGLIESWEMGYGTSAANPDSDGDGMLDGHEHRAGTAPTDGESALVIAQIVTHWSPSAHAPASENDLAVVWNSVEGKTYQVEFTENYMTDTPVYSDVGSQITATGEESALIIPNARAHDNGHYRVKLIE